MNTPVSATNTWLLLASLKPALLVCPHPQVNYAGVSTNNYAVRLGCRRICCCCLVVFFRR